MTPVSIDILCGDLAEVMAKVPKERPAYIGSVPQPDTTVVVLTSDDGDFTVMIQLPDGRTCTLASGWDWTAAKKGVNL